MPHPAGRGSILSCGGGCAVLDGEGLAEGSASCSAVVVTTTTAHDAIAA